MFRAVGIKTDPQIRFDFGPLFLYKNNFIPRKDRTSEEVMMFRKRTHLIGVATLALLMVIAFAACQKVNIKILAANYHFSKGNQLYKDAKYRKAITEYELALQNNPGLNEAYRFLGESYKSLFIPARDTKENMENATKALDALKKAYDLEPNNKDIIYSLGDMYDRLRDFSNAEKMYLKIIDLEPGNMNNYYVIAEFYKRYAADKPEIKKKAEDMYYRRIETDPESGIGYAYLANYYDNIQPIPEFDKALTFQKMRLELDPKNAEVYYTIGVNRFFKAYRLQNVLSEAEKAAIGKESEEALFKAIELDPSWPEPYSYVNMLYRNIFAKIYPEKESRYINEADAYVQKYNDARKRQLERIKLEKELKKTG
jgi:tetratricopeptide (TPR) repeat protein